MASENVKSGEVVKIRVFIYDGTQPVTGLSLVISIERLVDGFFWDGASFVTGFRTNAMTELTPSNTHNDGVYEYSFPTEAAPQERVYDWSNTHPISAFRDIITRGRIRTYNL